MVGRRVCVCVCGIQERSGEKQLLLKSFTAALEIWKVPTKWEIRPNLLFTSDVLEVEDRTFKFNAADELLQRDANVLKCALQYYHHVPDEENSEGGGEEDYILIWPICHHLSLGRNICQFISAKTTKMDPPFMLCTYSCCCLGSLLSPNRTKLTWIRFIHVIFGPIVIIMIIIITSSEYK